MDRGQVGSILSHLSARMNSHEVCQSGEESLAAKLLMR